MKMINRYEQAKALLTSQGKFYINLGLERIKSVLDLLGNPQEKIKVIHIAGTNGKGSVCAVLSNILKCSGCKTGLYTSPHLVEYTDRIKINNKEIYKEDFALYVEEITSLADNNNIDLTEFEILTACAFKYFADNNVDIAVMETGLGGRYDATNVCSKPVLEIITSISLDHTDRLGDTIEKIAYEKAGIIKNAVVVSAQNSGFQTICDVAKSVNADILAVENDIEIKYSNNNNIALINGEKYDFPLLGLYQKQNLALVIKAVEYLKTQGYKINLKEGLETVKWPARLEYRPKQNMLIDGAHNPDAADELKKSLDYYFKNDKKIFIYSTINTKDYEKIAKILFNPKDEIYYLEFNHKNAVSFDEYKSKVNWLENLHKISFEELANIINRSELTVLTGSLYMIGEVYSCL
jgi:dihydrofolate synthase/folylpolyglutamate synthase